jgi:hypothetical protein
MAVEKCPLCESPCIIKIIATEDKRWCEVDVCEMCGTMYPRGRDVVQVRPKAKARAKARPKGAKKTKR